MSIIFDLIAPRFVRALICLVLVAPLWLCNGCQRAADPQGHLPARSAPDASASDACILDTAELRKLRGDIAAPDSAGGKPVDALAGTQQTLQHWMNQCADRGSEFDRLAVGTLWNRIGASWEHRSEHEQAVFAFKQAESLLRGASIGEEQLVALRGLATNEWSRGNHQTGLELAREQLAVARAIQNENPATASFLIDSLEFASEFVGKAGFADESAKLVSEAKSLHASMESRRPPDEVPMPTTR
jgi:hypothetical protein